MCSPVCERPSNSRSYLKCFIYLRFLSKSAIQYYAVTSVSQREMKNRAMTCAENICWHINMRLTQHCPPVCYCHMLSLQDWIRCLQVNNHTSPFWQCLATSVLTVVWSAWLFWTVNVTHCLKVHTISTVLTYECSQILDTV